MEILALECRHQGEETLLLSVLPGTPPKALCITTQSKLATIPLEELDVLWHFDPERGWIADREDFGPRP